MIKVVIITNIQSPYRVDLFNYLNEMNSDIDLTIIYSAEFEDNRKWKIKSEGILKEEFLKSYTIKINNKIDTKYIHVSYNVFSVLNRINPQIVIGSEYNPTILQALTWCRSKKRKFISWSDGTLNSEKNINIIQKISRKIIIKNSQAYIASSTKTKEAQIYYGANKNKIYTSYLTVDIEKYLYKKEKFNSVNLLYVGSLVKRKGVDLLIKALSHINLEYNLTIIGEGPEKDSLINKAIELGVNEKIRFVGFKDIEELNNYYRKSDIFILPTREDCFGLVILEAMCNSMCVVSSKYADGAYDLIKNDSGIIVDPYNEIEFANALEKLISNKKLVESISKNAYKNSTNFSFEKVSKGFVDAIKSV